jgi:xanthine dehydrogenase accessory factor
MTHELLKILGTAYLWGKAGNNLVMASVVALEGSSYRRPGVRMLINESGATIGAVSGGCVEKEVIRQAQSVFQTGVSKMMTYDGRYRLGCEGVLYVLIEPCYVAEELWTEFQKVIKNRESFQLDCYYRITEGSSNSLGTLMLLNDQKFPINAAFDPKNDDSPQCFSQSFPPLFRLFIFGAEHDAVELCKLAHQLGWEVTVVASPDEAKSIEYFPGASYFLTPTFEEIDASLYNHQSALILMSHSFHKDLRYLMALKNSQPSYMGLLGPIHRRERMFSQLLELCPDLDNGYIDQINGPAGLNLGAENAVEIAVSIVAEILSVLRKKEPTPLRYKAGKIHG